MTREAKEEDLNALLQLYLYLHEEEIPEDSQVLRETWDTIMKDKNHHIILNVADGVPVSSCVCVIVPNLTRGVRPYAFIENMEERIRGRMRSLGLRYIIRISAFDGIPQSGRNAFSSLDYS